MDISSVTQSTPQLTTQQASAAAAVSDDFVGDLEPVTAASSSTGPAGTSLSGSTTASLSDQTLQALLNLTQNDPAGQAQGAQHHHHRHHGGGQPAASSTAANATSDPTASIAELGSGSATGTDDSDSLATALGA